MARPDRVIRPPSTNSLVASAARISDERLAPVKPSDWQAEAWRFYDSIGELRFAVTYTANALSRVTVHAAELHSDGEVERLPDEHPAALEVARLGEGNVARIMREVGTLLSVPGIGYIIGETNDEDGSEQWYVVSGDHLDMKQGAYRVRMSAERARGWRELAEEAVVIQVWRPHANAPWLADSPVRAALGVLAEIEMLTRRIRADGLSRLAGAGVFVVPSEATFASPVTGADQPTGGDPLLDALVDAMVTPISDPDSAAAVVPLLVRVPGESADKLTHLRFGTDFDARVLDLLQQAIRRLAIAVDLPPEVLLGMGDVNHWSAWAIEETSIKFHTEPLAEVVCGAFTDGFLQPALKAQGIYDPSIVCWYDSTALRVRSDRTESAVALHDRAVINDDALLRETGFTEADLCSPEQRTEQMLRRTGMNDPASVPAVLPLLDPNAPPWTGADPGAGIASTPAPADVPANDGPPAVAASSALDPLVAACDQVVLRAMERAGNRLRSKLGGGVVSGPASEFHTLLEVESMSTASLLESAWSGVPALAERHGVESDALAKHLDDYARWLLVTGTPHSFDRFVEHWDGCRVPL